MATPPSLPQDFSPDRRHGPSRSSRRAIADGRTWLDPIEVAQLLAAYAIPIVPVRCSRATPTKRRRRRRRSSPGGTTVVVKILSPDIVHKSEVGGVRLNLTSERAVREAVDRHSRPRARGEAGCTHHRRDRPSDDRAAEGARADRRGCRRSDLRAGHRLRSRRNGGRGDQRQGVGACRRSTSSWRATLIARTRVSRHAQGLSRRPGRRRGWRGAARGQACAARRRCAGDPRARSQSAARRREWDRRRRCAHRGRARRPDRPWAARPSAFRHPALPQGMGTARFPARRYAIS